jgi:hypothetical protein
MEGPNRVGATFLLPEDENRSSFRNVVFLRKYQRMIKVQKPYSFKNTTICENLPSQQNELSILETRLEHFMANDKIPLERV